MCRAKDNALRANLMEETAEFDSITNKKIGHIIGETSQMMCPTFILFDFVGAIHESPVGHSRMTPTNPYKSRIT